jgi:hypothetical protein
MASVSLWPCSAELFLYSKTGKVCGLFRFLAFTVKVVRKNAV